MNKTSVALSSIALVISLAVLAFIWKISTEISVLSAQIEQANPTIGKTISNKISSEVESQLASIESQLDDKSKWPTTPEGVHKINDSLTNFVNNLSPSVQEELYPRIAQRRWELDALWVLVSKATDSKGLDEHAQALNSLLDQKPIAASSTLEDRLKIRQKEIESQITDADHASAIEYATNVISGNGDPQTALRMLEKYNDNLANELTGKLRKKVMTLAIAKDIESLGTELKQYSMLGDQDLKEYGFTRLHQSIQEIRLRMVESGISDDKLQSNLATLKKNVTGNLVAMNKVKRKVYDEKVKLYLSWAVGEINKVRSYKKIEEEQLNKLSIADRHNPISDANKKAINVTNEIIRDDLIRYMSKINQGALDEAVGQWFRKVYQDRFERLDDDEKLKVVNGFAFASKWPVE
ncbi:MAG: hypothetical protein Q8M99_05405 [Methylotenera sp.]|nr:hypothetical protein [Methylotenera sp.]